MSDGGADGKGGRDQNSSQQHLYMDPRQGLRFQGHMPCFIIRRDPGQE